MLTPEQISWLETEQEAAYDLIAPWYEDWQVSRNDAQWAGWLERFMPAAEASSPQGTDGKRLICDLGCGTGSLLREFAVMGWDGIGIDRSLGMLNEARHEQTGSSELLYLEQDLTAFELFGTVNVMLCLMDTVNHLLNPEDVRRFFKLVHNYLHPGGRFIFDVATLAHLGRTLGQQQFYTIDDRHALFWAHHYDETEALAQSDLTLFTLRQDGLWDRGDGIITERWYARNDLEAWLRDAGFSRSEWRRAPDEDEPWSEAERVFCFADY